MPRKIRKTLIAFLSIVAAVYIANAAVIFFAQPVSTQFNATGTQIAKIGNISIMGIDDLQSGGVGGLSRGTAGYVNVLNPDPIIYLNNRFAKKVPTQADYLYQHEYAHILQKELIASYAGGYPSYWNPVQSAKYYYYLIKLDRDLQKLMPAVNTETEGSVLFPGLESAAECYAQPYSDEENPEYYKALYLYPGYCDAEQKKIMVKFISEKWPAPLSDEDRKDLKPVSIYVDKTPKNVGTAAVKKLAAIGKQISGAGPKEKSEG